MVISMMGAIAVGRFSREADKGELSLEESDLAAEKFGDAWGL